MLDMASMHPQEQLLSTLRSFVNKILCPKNISEICSQIQMQFFRSSSRRRSSEVSSSGSSVRQSYVEPSESSMRDAAIKSCIWPCKEFMEGAGIKEHDWIFSTMNYNVQSLLELWRCSAFMFCGLKKGQRDTMLSCHIMIVLTKCWHLRYLIIARQLIMPLI